MLHVLLAVAIAAPPAPPTPSEGALPGEPVDQPPPKRSFRGPIFRSREVRSIAVPFPRHAPTTARWSGWRSPA